MSERPFSGSEPDAEPEGAATVKGFTVEPEPAPAPALPDEVSQFYWAATQLADGLESHTALVRGLPVPRDQLKPDALALISDRVNGRDLTLTDDLALLLSLRSKGVESQQAASEHEQEQAGEEAPAAPFAIEVRTTRELADLPDPAGTDELLGPLVVRGQRLVLGGHTGEGKTTFALAVARALAEDGDFLDWRAQAGKVLVIDAEQGLRTIKRRIAEAGLEACDAVDYARVPDGLALDKNVHHVAAVEELIEAGDYALVIADPLYKLHSGDSNAEREAVDLMRKLDAWRERYAFALALPVHCRKPVPGVKFSIHDLFGSSAYVRGAEVVLGLQRVSDGYSRLHFLKDRDGDLPIGDVWGLLFDREHGFRRDPKDTEERDPAGEVAAFLAGAEPSTVPEIARGVGMADKTVRDLLRSDPGRFRLVPAPAGRHPNAKVWALIEATRPGPQTRRDETGQEALPHYSSGPPIGATPLGSRDEFGRPLVPEAVRDALDDDDEGGEDGLAWR